MVLAELALPAIAGATPWHRGHFIEHHGLLTLIALGEGIVSVGLILSAWFHDRHFTGATVPTALAAAVIVSAM